MIKSFVWNLTETILYWRESFYFWGDLTNFPSLEFEVVEFCFRTKVGTFSWVLGYDCKCGANLSPAFVLDMTGLIFKTGGRHLHTGSARQPVVVWLTLAMALLHNSITGAKKKSELYKFNVKFIFCRKRSWT